MLFDVRARFVPVFAILLQFDLFENLETIFLEEIRVLRLGIREGAGLE